MKKNRLIDRALELRYDNLSLREISNELHVSKSTVSLWLRNTPNKKISKLGKERMLEALKRGRETSLKNRKLIPISKLKFNVSVRKRMFRLRGKICEICGWKKENPFYKEIPVHVHHIDGNKKNNEEINLQILCPNCHALTKHYGFFGRRHPKNKS